MNPKRLYTLLVALLMLLAPSALASPLDVDQSATTTLNDMTFIYRRAVLGLGAEAEGVLPAGMPAPAIGIEAVIANIDGVAGLDVDATGAVTINDVLFLYRRAVLGLGNEPGGVLAAGAPLPAIGIDAVIANVDALSSGLLSEFVLIPAGTNSGTDPDFGAYSLTVADAFYMGRTELRWDKWQAVRAWAVNNGYDLDDVGAGKAADHPVHSVSWYDVVKWCNARSEQEGRTPCYTVSAAIYRTGESDDVLFNASANGYRLPTEIEWEYAARGGNANRRFPWGDTIDHSRANYQSIWPNGQPAYDTATDDYHPMWDDGVWPYTSVVGSFAANGYGLQDMSGNVLEWCWDLGSASSSDRVIRGGSWIYGARFCRSAARAGGGPGYRGVNSGLRLALPAGP